MVTRGIALFLGMFSLLNCIGGLFKSGFDANMWWVRLAPLPLWLGDGVVFVGALALLACAWPLATVPVRRGAAIVLAIVALFTLANCVEFFELAWGGKVHPWVPLPLSALVTGALIRIVIDSLKVPAPRSKWDAPALVATLAALVVAFPLAQMFFFGTTDYRRGADVAVVFGARTYADGTASQALSDRVNTAVGLYHQGLVDRLVFSGGPGDGATSEPQAMRRIAIDRGVPDGAIVLDEQGLNTDVTVKNTVAMFPQLNVRRVLVVSHAYHLPRVKLTYQRAGWEVRTVPARQSRRLRNEPIYIAREVVALWAYYLRPIVS